jgi:hypothetical protein
MIQTRTLILQLDVAPAARADRQGFTQQECRSIEQAVFHNKIGFVHRC